MENKYHTPMPWPMYWKQLITVSRKLKPLILTQLLTGFSLMVLPFYVVYSRDQLGAPADAIGWFLMAQVLGGSISGLVWARIVDKSGSKTMLIICAVISALTPALAVAIQPFGWKAMLPVFFLAGSVYNGRTVGFKSALLELAPIAERSTYAGLNAVLTLPVALLPITAGLLLNYWSFSHLFLIASIFIGIGAVAITKWSLENKQAR